MFFIQEVLAGKRALMDAGAVSQVKTLAEAAEWLRSEAVRLYPAVTLLRSIDDAMSGHPGKRRAGANRG